MKGFDNLQQHEKELEKTIAQQKKELVNIKKTLLEERAKFAYLKKIIALLPGNIFWKDNKGFFLGCNNNVARILNLKSPSDIVGKTNSELFDAHLADQATIADNKTMLEDKEYALEETGLDVNGNLTTYLTKKVPVHDERNNVMGLLGVSFDISDRKKAEKKLKIAKRKAEESNELKSQFIMNIQHDLRTPASGVTAMLKILAKKETDSDKKEILELMAESSQKLLNILNTILDFDNIEKGSFPVLSEKFNLHNIIHDVKALESPAAKLKHLDIKTHIDDRLPQELIGDPFRIQRILINLLSNAIKFTTKGYVEIDELLWKHVDDRNVLVQIIVKDTGIGIPKDKQKVIFKRFTRLDPSNKGIYSGLGLGLNMVKQFVEEIKGSIEVKSNPGQGTTFTCILPFKLPLLN